MNKKVLTLAAVALTFSVGANAQLNLKGLVKNATKKVKEKVEKTANETVGSETGSKTLDISSAVSGDYDPSKNYSPSKEAKAADAFASATQKFDGMTKNMSQLCGAYEHLPKSAFPYQPYYQYNQLYYFDRQECDKFCNSVSAAMLKALMGSKASAVNDNRGFSAKGKAVLLPSLVQMYIFVASACSGSTPTRATTMRRRLWK